MNKKKFIKLFLKLMEDVLGLFPETKICEGVWLYVSRNGKVRIPVFVGSKGLKFFLSKIDPKMRVVSNQVLNSRLAMIGTLGDFRIEKVGEEFQTQVIISGKNLNLFCKRIKETQNTHRIKAPVYAYLEAECVEYMCHEFRHLAQMFSIEKRNLFSSFANLPKFQNGLCGKTKLVRFYRKWAKGQMRLYRDHYKDDSSKKTLLRMEKDAMIIELLAFDCWISQKFSYREKVRMLEKILWFKKR